MAKTQYSGDIYKYVEDDSKMQSWGIGLQMDEAKMQRWPPNYFALKGDTTLSDVENVTITISTASTDEVAQLTTDFNLEKV
tara:strand:- start:354 stop:596 length:243 start_codon:yes stop_codon:yes gene_type:complete